MLRSPVDFVLQEVMHLIVVNKNMRNLTCNPTQAQPEPKLQNETANMEFEQVNAKKRCDSLRLM